MVYKIYSDDYRQKIRLSSQSVVLKSTCIFGSFKINPKNDTGNMDHCAGGRPHHRGDNDVTLSYRMEYSTVERG
jgi:hypothetical protein